MKYQGSSYSTADYAANLFCQYTQFLV